MEFKIKSIKEINVVARQFIEKMGNRKVFLFNGKMGAGKTTFIKAICEEMGVQETVNSPTFSIINEYEAAKGEIIYHFDCYRIKNIEEAKDIGVEEYLYSGNYCFIEWAENIASLLPAYAVNVEIIENVDGTRIVEAP
jgi:tRNA threonylcarbamoyladenosine biosynthesis protein TsaE